MKNVVLYGMIFITTVLMIKSEDFVRYLKIQ